MEKSKTNQNRVFHKCSQDGKIWPYPSLFCSRCTPVEGKSPPFGTDFLVIEALERAWDALSDVRDDYDEDNAHDPESCGGGECPVCIIDKATEIVPIEWEDMTDEQIDETTGG